MSVSLYTILYAFTLQYVEGSEYRPISLEDWALVNKLCLKKLSLAGIARVTGISMSHLQDYVNRKLESVPRKAEVMPKKRGRLALEMDEMWSFVCRKRGKQWIWIALDAGTREVVGSHGGDRSRRSAQALWKSLPGVYRQCAVCYTDYWEAYESVIPGKRHRAVGKESGKTNPIERFNNTLRQRVSRLVQKTLSFSKKLENPIGALWYFVHDYNAKIHARRHYCG